MQKVGHIVARCLRKEERDERKEGKYKGRRDDKDYKRRKDEKGNKSCYIIEEEIDNESTSNDDEVVYVAMKEDSNEDEKTSLISYVNKNDIWIIDSGCSNHMIGDKDKFENIGPYKGECVKFGNDIPFIVKGKGTIQLDDKITCDNIYWVEGLNYNLLSVSKLNKSSQIVEF